MAIDLTTISMPMAALLASLIGATATITASLLQLRMAWKKELLARESHKPLTRKSRRGPIYSVLALLIASAVGGFALSHYLASKTRSNAAALEAELHTRIEQLSLSAQRLENVRLDDAALIAQQVRDEERRRRGEEGSSAMVILEKCAGVTVEGETLPAACSEATVRPVRLCAEIPADARVATIDLYARPEGSSHSWGESRVVAGSDFGGGRFSSRSTERLISDTTRQVCHELLHWSSEHVLNGRMVVHYGLAE